MKFNTGGAEKWKGWVDKNSDPYGKCCVDFARSWAMEMEKRMDGGESLEQMAKSSSFEVNKREGYGITGFMYGAAVSMLSQVWFYGETLRKWHNLDTQIGDEGEQANKKGGVLDPSRMTIDTGGK